MRSMVEKRTALMWPRGAKMFTGEMSMRWESSLTDIFAIRHHSVKTRIEA